MFSHHERNERTQVRVGIGLPAEPRSKEATGLERHFICSAQRDMALAVTGASSVPTQLIVEEWPAIGGRARFPCGPLTIGSFPKVSISPIRKDWRDRLGGSFLFDVRGNNRECVELGLRGARIC